MAQRKHTYVVTVDGQEHTRTTARTYTHISANYRKNIKSEEYLDEIRFSGSLQGAQKSHGSWHTRWVVSEIESPEALMDRLNALEKYPDAGTPFTDVAIIPGYGGEWWIEGKGSGGAKMGFYYASLTELVRRWKVRLTRYDITTNRWEGSPL